MGVGGMADGGVCGVLVAWSRRAEQSRGIGRKRKNRGNRTEQRKRKEEKTELREESGVRCGSR